MKFVYSLVAVLSFASPFSHGQTLLKGSRKKPSAATSGKSSMKRLWASERLVSTDKPEDSGKRDLRSADPFGGLQKPLAAFQQCFESCGLPSGEEEADLGLGSDLPSIMDWDRPPCCKGGVSALKMVYVGTKGATFFLPNDPALNNLSIMDACDDNESSNPKKPRTPQASFVMFANCERCFPQDGIPLMTCDPTTDLWDSLSVDENEHICVVSIDTTSGMAMDVKMPTNLVLFYQLANNGNTTQSLTIHTSCSKPIYPPYGIQLGVCGNDAYVDLSLPGFESSSSSHIQFQDGTSAKFSGSLLSSASCESVPEGKPDDNCCEGGVSFLKMKFGGSLSGILTFDAQDADRYSECYMDTNDKAGIFRKKGSSAHGPKKEEADVRFVSCSDACLANPLDSIPCDYSFEVQTVDPGDYICMAIVDSNGTDLVMFDQKMPTNLGIFLVPTNSTMGTYAAQIHTSCSKPLHAPYAQPFSHVCDGGESFPIVNLEESPKEVSSPHFQFLDGLSPRYFQAAKQINSSSVNFGFSLASCHKCVCNTTLALSCNTTIGSSPPGCPPLGSAPSSNPTPAPLLVGPPVILDTNSPTASPTLQPTELSSKPSAPPSSNMRSFRPSARTNTPSRIPTVGPSSVPTRKLTQSPSANPSSAPDPTSQPSAITSHPSAFPSSLGLTSFPTEIPTGTPTATPPGDQQQGPDSPGADCANKCKAWVKTNCVFFRDGVLSNEECDVDSVATFKGVPQQEFGEDGGRRLQQSLKILTEKDSPLVFETIAAEREYHASMVVLYKELLSWLDV